MGISAFSKKLLTFGKGLDTYMPFILTIDLFIVAYQSTATILGLLHASVGSLTSPSNLINLVLAVTA